MKDPSKSNESTPLIFVPIILFIATFCSLGYFAARANFKYRTVKALIYPVSFALSQLSGGMVFLCFGWIISMLVGSTESANYIVGNITDLTLITLLFDELSIPISHVIVFQTFVWWIFGRSIARHIAFSIYDWAIQARARINQIHPWYEREDVLKHDDGYAKAFEVYKNKGKPPLLGLFFVMMSPTPVAEYY